MLLLAYASIRGSNLFRSSVHVLLSVLDHALHHLAADAARLTGGQIAVVPLLQIDVQGRSLLGLEVAELILVFRNHRAVACHLRFTSFALLFAITFPWQRRFITGKNCNRPAKVREM